MYRKRRIERCIDGRRGEAGHKERGRRSYGAGRGVNTDMKRMATDGTNLLGAALEPTAGAADVKPHLCALSCLSCISRPPSLGPWRLSIRFPVHVGDEREDNGLTSSRWLRQTRHDLLLAVLARSLPIHPSGQQQQHRRPETGTRSPGSDTDTRTCWLSLDREGRSGGNPSRANEPKRVPMAITVVRTT